ncbi:GxxExxY protein [Ancylomarina euxinus]|uniref:GxxExxY protein n=1 Tax=Ancylomarina euxinus TaxID=2283627 RepID=A0A425XY34_9BACT|nr:GxxExxY protein [Ancylomarina euxinus]MCZ4695923.1 GxxExxY protein [Ancylomarina euxinus]MUP16838.1 GxxExxY protein [Ancylomarina euxinus]RRG19691.1 GxxExxY protein [Ancylomarina euxinus]
MKSDRDNIYKQECYDIVGLCMAVHSELGPGFLEGVYQEALEIEFIKSDIDHIRECQIEINYKGIILDKRYYADFLCHNEVIVELKVVKSLDDNHMAQLMNYMKATDKKVGLLVNFGSHSLGYKRVIL